MLRVIHDARVSDERRVALEAAHSDRERRVAERTGQLRAALEQAEGAMRAKEIFLSTVSHELRTPLNAILGWARMLTAPDSDKAFIERGLAVIDRNATVQAQLVEDLLDVSRLDTGRLQLQMHPVDLVQVVSESVETIRPAAEAKGVALTVADGPERLALVGDGRRLQQIVWNLLSNAVKFTAARGRVLVSIGLRQGRASIEVNDTGIGIDPAFLPHLFERFTQADSSLTRTHQGLGLGLAIVRQLVELHGGSITARSAGPGTGATFRVELPVRPAANVRVPAERARTLQDMNLSGIRVLVVDDDEDARETLGVMLARSGASVITTATAEAAFEALQGHRFDVLLSDLGMPIRDGYDLIRQIRRTNDDRIRRTPAIAVSAYAHEDDRARAIAAGFHLHVAKPVTPEELVSAVSALISR